jgi:EAL domain-containing protein (putative c-di-GMP-specific phosphodiesterase class I)
MQRFDVSAEPGERQQAPVAISSAASIDPDYLERELRDALRRGELSLYYQPQFALPQVRLVGSEALLRWNHPERGLISPGRFIPTAERCGLIVPIGTWVLEQACQQNYCWQQAGYEPIRVAVNVAAKQFAQYDFVDLVSQALSTTGLAPQYLELEMSESLLMRDVEESVQTLSSLKMLGVKLSMDDFGTGTSSLRDLARLPIDTLKIDMEFVQRLNSVPSTLRFVKAMLALGHGFGMRVMAVGVETEEQLEQLRQLGCESAQGYLFGAAVSPTESESYRTAAGPPPEPKEPA